MSNKNFKHLLMALVAMSFFGLSSVFAQSNSSKSNFKIKTPNTKSQLLDEDTSSTSSSNKYDGQYGKKESSSSSAAPRRVQQHGIGAGIGETFLLGKYKKSGEDKITMDLFYTYAASYSFDLLVNAHSSEHKFGNEKVKILGLASSIKARIVEYDNFSPYLLGGLGFYAPQVKRNVNGENVWSDQKITFGLNLGGGVDLRLNEHYVIGLIGQLHWPFTIRQDQGPDVKGQYFKLLITGMYLF